MSIKSLYKFQPIFDESNLDKEYSIINLASKQVAFSTRKSFNDIFDTKINLISPSKSDLDSTYKSLSGQEKYEFKNKYISNNTKTPLEDVEKALNKRIDTYLFYCVTDNCMNNLMWGHYASSHKGFCIEWDASKLLAKKVNYKKKIASLNIINFLKPEILVNPVEFQKRIIDAFSTKLLSGATNQSIAFTYLII